MVMCLGEGRGGQGLEGRGGEGHSQKQLLLGCVAYGFL